MKEHHTQAARDEFNARIRDYQTRVGQGYEYKYTEPRLHVMTCKFYGIYDNTKWKAVATEMKLRYKITINFNGIESIRLYSN